MRLTQNCAADWEDVDMNEMKQNNNILEVEDIRVSFMT